MKLSTPVTQTDPTSQLAMQTNWERMVNRLAQASWITLIGTIGLGLVAGSIVAVIWRPEVDWTVYSAPYGLQGLGFMLALLLALPSLIAGIWKLVRGRWKQGVGRLLAFFGPFVVAVGNELGSHLLIQCDLAPWLCVNGNIYARWHQLHHTLLAGVPLLALSWLAFRRWGTPVGTASVHTT